MAMNRTLLRMISGARYSGVPHSVQVRPFTRFANPKSVTCSKKEAFNRMISNVNCRFKEALAKDVVSIYPVIKKLLWLGAISCLVYVYLSNSFFFICRLVVNLISQQLLKVIHIYLLNPVVAVFITNLNVTLLVDEDVLWFQISVDDV